ncbi:MAG: ABC transporter ATP-binding protein [Defluviitaleaceae bacterium]|nr:ABC transporter ATP-binding protein [Defluviitaleaceae bacterium]
MINLSNIQVHFGSFEALKSINLEVKQGEFFTLLGPSGCGKTTTLRTVTGFINPTKGKVEVDGKDITHLEIEKRNIGMVFQNYALFPTMSVYENIAFGLKVKKVSGDEIKTKIDEIARKVELEPMQLTKKISELSGGQQQRVAIARALVTSPSIICLDEPLSNLDAKLRVQLRNELKELQRRFGITTIYVTHDQEEALTLSDRIAVFNLGNIEQIGRPDEVYNYSATEFVCNFIGDINKLSSDFLISAGANSQNGVDTSKNCYIRLERLYVNNKLEHHLSCDAVVENFEYYGLYIKYALNSNGERLKVIEKNSGSPMYSIGSTVTVSFNPENIMQY